MALGVLTLLDQHWKDATSSVGELYTARIGHKSGDPQRTIGWAFLCCFSYIQINLLEIVD